jgi:hypothetical protein
MDKPGVFTTLHTFLTEQKRTSLTQEQFTLLPSSFEQKLAGRLKSQSVKRKRR